MSSKTSNDTLSNPFNVIYLYMVSVRILILLNVTFKISFFNEVKTSPIHRFSTFFLCTEWRVAVLNTKSDSSESIVGKKSIWANFNQPPGSYHWSPTFRPVNFSTSYTKGSLNQGQ